MSFTVTLQVVAWLAVENVDGRLFAPNVFQVAYHGKKREGIKYIIKRWLAKLQMTDGKEKAFSCWLGIHEHMWNTFFYLL